MTVNPNLTIICVYNRKKDFEEYLEYGLQNQNGCDFERIFIDNSDNQYSSAAAALNAGVNKLLVGI